MATGDEGSPQPPKRRKVAESCKICRAKKTRCDGQRPICSPCKSKNVLCEYNDATIPVSTGVLSSIEERLQRLEQLSATGPAYSPARVVAADSSTPLQQQKSPSAHTAIYQESVDLRTDVSESEGDLGFTDNSTAQFMRDITKIAEHQPNSQAQDSLWGKPDAWSVETDTSAMVVPKRAIADDLLVCYERYLYPLFPILHMPTFRTNYNRLWGQEKESLFKSLAEEVVFYATLNVVFALGCLCNSKVDQRLQMRTAETFYRRARALLPLDALDITTLEVVQLLLLTSNYLSFTKYANRCSNTLALAIRVAQTLGLHMEHEPPFSNQLKQEMSKRVWQHCVALERLYCSLFGRLSLVEIDCSKSLPDCIDDEYLLEEGMGTQPADLPSVLDAFIVTIKIFEVLSKARKITYGLTLPELTEVLQLNEGINQIEHNLPSHLRYTSIPQPTTPRNRMLHLQAEAVMTRILHTRLILLRPNVMVAARRSLAHSSEHRPPSRTEMALQAEVSSLCVQAAVSAIEMIHENLDSNSRIISSNAVFVTLAAATVIVAASLVPELEIAVDIGNGGGSYGEVVSKALQVLEDYRWQHEGALVAKHQLEKFMKTVHHAEKQRADGPDYQVATQTPIKDAAQLPSESEDVFASIDFTDPLWDFQWSGHNTFNVVQGSYFEYQL